MPAKKHSQASTIAVMVAALCLGAAYVSTTTGPAWAEEFFTGGGDDGYNPDDSVLCPGVKPGTNQYCDCSLDCREYRDKYCFCAEARAEDCCGFSPACVDSPEDKWTYDGGPKGKLGCTHIRNSEDKKIRDKRCARVGKNGATGAEACPVACGLCKRDILCADNSEFRYWAGYKGYVGCSHVAGGTDSEKEKRCERESDNGVKVKNACPVACGTCDEWIVKAFACSQCREKDGVSSCENQWKCVFPGDQCEGACIGCNKRNDDLCYQLEQLL